MFDKVTLAENCKFLLNGRTCSRETARTHWLDYDANRGSDPAESSWIFSRVDNSESAREFVLESGVEVILCLR